MLKKKFPMSSFSMDDGDFPLESPASGLSIFEEGDTVVIEAALPGLTTEDIEITHAHGYILIEGERKEEEKKKRYYSQARQVFSYRVPIPTLADLSHDPETTCSDGVVKLIFRKKGK